jgi:transcriptional regulator with XRE-family HTH domain
MLAEGDRMTVVERWVGREARLLREAMRLTVRDFAEDLGVNPRTVSRWEASGDRAPGPELQRALDTVLARADPGQRERFLHTAGRARPGADTGTGPEPASDLSQPVASRPPGSGVSRDEDSIGRRAFVTALGATGTAAATGPDVTWELIRHGTRAEFVDDSEGRAVQEWQQIAQDYGRSYLTTPAAALLDGLAVDLMALRSTLPVATGGILRQERQQVAALLAMFTALTLGNLGRLPEAYHWWRTARQIADQCGDRSTQLTVRGRESVRALHEGRSPQRILRLISDAERLEPVSPSAGWPELLCGKAQALAVLGREREALAALGELSASFSDLPAAVADDRQSFLGWPENRLRFTESFVYAHLGRLAEAQAAQGRAITLYPAGYPQGPAQIELQRALCQVVAGDVGGGVAHAYSVMVGLPAEHHVRPVSALGRRVLHVVPQAERDRPDVVDFSAYLTGNTSGPSKLVEAR